MYVCVDIDLELLCADTTVHMTNINSDSWLQNPDGEKQQG